jgi:hypothetical protein
MRHVGNQTPIKRSKVEYTDYTKATSLTSWLFLKYDMTYKQFRNKSKSRRNALREEYKSDTGRYPFNELYDENFNYIGPPAPPSEKIDEPDIYFSVFLAKHGRTINDYNNSGYYVQQEWKEDYKKWKNDLLIAYKNTKGLLGKSEKMVERKAQKEILPELLGKNRSDI